MERPIANNNIEAFCHDPEGHYFDRKSARKDPDEIAKHIMAFANAAGGKLVVGIEDDGAITGFKRDGAHTIESLERAHVTQLKPTLHINALRFPTTNVHGENDQVLVLDVEYSDDQVIRRRKDGMVALRDGDRSVTLDYEQIRALEYDKGAVRYESIVCRDSCLEDIDYEAVALYKAALGTTADDNQVLRGRHFLKGEHLTNASVLLFAREPSFILPQARIRVVRIDGTELGTGAHMNVVKDKTFDGPLVKAYPEAKAFIASQLRDFQFEQPGATFATVPEYPEFPWAEGLANAIAHRDYSLEGEYIRVYIFEDRMEITSPGNTPNYVTIDTMRDTRYSRNPRLAHALTAFEWVREFNEGVKKTRLHKDDPLAHKKINGGINGGIKLSSDEEAILSALRSAPGGTYAELAQTTGFSERKVSRIIANLKEHGFIERAGSKKNGLWIVSGEPFHESQ